MASSDDQSDVSTDGQPNNSSDKGLTLTVLGCGTLGIAILSGIFSSLTKSASSGSEPPIVPSRFIACVRSDASAKRIKKALSSYPTPVQILQNQNLQGVKQADIILLACKPKNVNEGIISGSDMRDALNKKLLISILAGTTAKALEAAIYEAEGWTSPENRCRIVRVMPNTAAKVRSSMTIIADPDPPLSPTHSSLLTWIFTRIGRVQHLPPYLMDTCTALCGSGPAFFSLVLEAAAFGAVQGGLETSEAQMLAAQTMKGAAEMVLNGQHPALLRDSVSTPGGCTVQGLQVLENGKVRAEVAAAVTTAAMAASQLGKRRK